MEISENGETLISVEEWEKNSIEDFRLYIANLNQQELSFLLKRDDLSLSFMAMIEGRLRILASK